MTNISELQLWPYSSSADFSDNSTTSCPVLPVCLENIGDELEQCGTTQMTSHHTCIRGRVARSDELHPVELDPALIACSPEAALLRQLPQERHHSLGAVLVLHLVQSPDGATFWLVVVLTERGVAYDRTLQLLFPADDVQN